MFFSVKMIFQSDIFQPDNILIGQDGRYKIGDLGLMNGRNRADSQKEYREGTFYTYFLWYRLYRIVLTLDK